MMLKIPKTTDPKTKFIRTGEGVLVFAFNVAMVVVPIVSSALSAEQAVKYAAILNAVAVFSRSGLKAAALLPRVTGVPAPQVSQPVTQDTAQIVAQAVRQLLQDSENEKTPSVDQVGAQIDQDVQSVDKLVSDAEDGAKAADHRPARVSPSLIATAPAAANALSAVTPQSALQPPPAPADTPPPAMAQNELQPPPAPADTPPPAMAQNELQPPPAPADTPPRAMAQNEIERPPTEAEVMASTTPSSPVAPSMAADGPATARPPSPVQMPSAAGPEAAVPPDPIASAPRPDGPQPSELTPASVVGSTITDGGGQ
jgi:hypothetical protein